MYDINHDINYGLKSYKMFTYVNFSCHNYNFYVNYDLPKHGICFMWQKLASIPLYWNGECSKYPYTLF